MTANQESHSDFNLNRVLNSSSDPGLKRFIERFKTHEKRDVLIQETLDHLQKTLEVNRVVLYYFYREWKGQVTFESLNHPQWSIYGSTGADECFNEEYAALYLAGRIRTISNIETEAIHPCHQNFLRQIQVKANLVVPILINQQKLWGLLIAHHCEDSHLWLSSELELFKDAAQTLAIQLAHLA